MNTIKSSIQKHKLSPFMFDMFKRLYRPAFRVNRFWFSPYLGFK